MPKRKHDAVAQGAPLLDLGRDSHVTQRGIEKLLHAVSKGGIPEHFSRRTQYRARKTFAATRTPHGRLIETYVMPTSSGDVPVGIQSPMPIIHYSLANCTGFRTLFREAARVNPVANPWHIILYNDGITPQDSASSHDKRKLVSFYWSFREFGQRALCTEEAWFILATVRLSVLTKYDGGLSRFVRECLTRFFFNTSGGCNFQDPGMDLTTGDVQGLLRAVLWCFIADEPAIKDFFNNKGHSGLLPCVLCSNVVLHRLYEEAVHVGFVTTACSNFEAFKRHSDASLRALHHDLAAKRDTLTPDEFNEAEISCGLNYSEHSLILDPHVAIASQCMFDWAHTYVVGGVADVEFGTAMVLLRRLRAPTTYAVLGDFVSQWTWPERQKPNLRKLFDKEAATSHYGAWAFKSTASEMLSLAPVLSFYFRHIALAQGFAVDIVRSLVAAFDVVALLQCVRHGVVTPEALRDSVERHMNLFKAAYGADACRPKHHYAMHLWLMLKIFGMLASCLPMERLHKIPKRYVKERRNTKSYEVGTLEDVTLKQLFDRREEWLAVDCLVAPHKPPPRSAVARVLKELHPSARTLTVAARMASKFGQVNIGDVVFFSVDGVRQCGRVKVHYDADGHTFSVIQSWERAPMVGIEVGADAMRFKVVANGRRYPSACIDTALIYSVVGEYATVLVPPLFR